MENAASLMKEFGHKACLEKQDPGLSWILAGGAAIYGVSQLRKRA